MPDYDRFGGIARVYGAAALQQFSDAHVMVIGVGGVGSWTVEALARSGIGRLTLLDLDDVCVSNTNRQLHTLSSTLGQFKVDVLAQRCLDINPAIQVQALQQFITPQNITQLNWDGVDYVVDAIDSVAAKVALIVHCKRQKIPFVMTGGAGGQVDPTRIQLVDLARTIQDPLAARVRSDLRKKHGFASAGKSMGVPCVFSDEPLVYPQPDGSACHTRQAAAGTGINCADGLGAVTSVTASFGMVAASAALRHLGNLVRHRNVLQN